MSESTVGQKLTVILPQAGSQSREDVPCFFGVSDQSAGAQGLSMHLIEIPPGGKAQPHACHDFETAIYVLAGRIETRYGDGLRASVINDAGTFLFIPAAVPHQPGNLSATKSALAIVARNNACEAEALVTYTSEV